ncbi:MAG: porin [Pseudomonadota bacterium]
MKKTVLAGLALGMGASAAAADVSFSGYGRFGLLYDEGNTDNKTRIEQRFRLNIDASTESDNGLRFAARLRVQTDDQEDGTSNVAENNAARFQVDYEGLRLQVGNISGVFDDESTVAYYGFEPGLVGLVGQYSTFQGPIVEYETGGVGVNGVSLLYGAGDLAVMASYNEDHDDDIGTDFTENAEVGIAYDFGPVRLAAAYGTQTTAGEDIDYYVLTADGSIGDLDYAVFIGDDDVGNETSYGLSGQYRVGAATHLVASYAGGGADDLDEAVGIGFRHDLGGGVRLSGMAGQNEEGDTVGDLGVRFDF